MIRNRTWRRALVATVLGADLVAVLVAGAHLPGFVPFAVGALVVGGYLLLTIALFAWFYPIYSAEVIPYAQWRRLMWFPSWI